MSYYRYSTSPTWYQIWPQIWEYEQQMMQQIFPKTNTLEYSKGLPYWTVRRKVTYSDRSQETWTLAAFYTMFWKFPIPIVIPINPSWKEIRRQFPEYQFYTQAMPDLDERGFNLLDEDKRASSINQINHYCAAEALTLAYEQLNQLALLPKNKLPYSGHPNMAPVDLPIYTNTAPRNTDHTDRNYPGDPYIQPRQHQKRYRTATQSSGIQLMPADMRSPECGQIVLSDRAFRGILAETSEFGDRETGGLMLGNFHKGFWYIIDAVDPGFSTVNHPTVFEYQVDYVNHLSKKLGRLYNHPLTIVGIWHRHPGSMDIFSATDYNSMASMVSTAAVGLIFMLVNVDPKLRMTFYYLNKQLELFRVPYVMGDAYIPPELTELAPPERLSYYHDFPVEIALIPHPDPQTFPQSIADLDRLGGTQNP